MNKMFECPLWSHTPMFLWENRQAVRAKFVDAFGNLASHGFLLDSGAIISTMTRETAETHGVFNKNVINDKAVVGGFTGIMDGRIICVEYLSLGILAVKNTLFFVPDEKIEVTEVIGANVLNGLIPIPEFDKIDKTTWDAKDKGRIRGRLWIMKNKNVPEPYFSKSLGVSVACEVLSQDDAVNQS